MVEQLDHAYLKLEVVVKQDLQISNLLGKLEEEVANVITNYFLDKLVVQVVMPLDLIIFLVHFIEGPNFYSNLWEELEFHAYSFYENCECSLQFALTVTTLLMILTSIV